MGELRKSELRSPAEHQHGCRCRHPKGSNTNLQEPMPPRKFQGPGGFLSRPGSTRAPGRLQRVSYIRVSAAAHRITPPTDLCTTLHAHSPISRRDAPRSPVRDLLLIDRTAGCCGGFGEITRGLRARLRAHMPEYAGPPPPSGTTQSMFCEGHLMSHVLQWMQFCALICSRGGASSSRMYS